LLQREGSASWATPLAAPVVDMLFRPEQEHGTSREDDVLIPVAGGHRDMDHAFLLQKPSIFYGQWHLEVAAGATCVDSGIFVQHGGDAKRVPDAVAPPGALANADGKRGRDRQNGAARQSSPFSCSMKAWLSPRRMNASLTFFLAAASA